MVVPAEGTPDGPGFRLPGGSTTERPGPTAGSFACAVNPEVLTVMGMAALVELDGDLFKVQLPRSRTAATCRAAWGQA